MEDAIYDVIVIGGGPAGLTAALYSSRADLSTLILDGGLAGGQLNNTEKIENYPGFSSISGEGLAKEMYDGAVSFGAEYKFSPVDEVTVNGSMKKVRSGKKTYQARAVIIATGAQNRKLGVPGEEELKGRGVSYCAVCDGAFYRNKEVVVVGGGDCAVEEGDFLTQFADKVTIVHRRDELRAQKVLQDRAFKNDKIDFIWDSELESIQGDPLVDHVVIRHVKTGETYDYPAQGVFVYIGQTPNTEAFSQLGILDDAGWIQTDEQMQTSQPGIFAAGDVRVTPLRQVATAVGDGAVAGQAAYDYIQTLSDD